MIRRHRGQTIAVIAVIGVSIVSCGRDTHYQLTDSRAAYWQGMTKAINARNPVAEAAANFGKNDLRFMAVCTDGLDIPGVEQRADASKLVEKYGTNPVPETSDAFEGESQERYQGAATIFCEKYNQEMLRLLNSRSAP